MLDSAVSRTRTCSSCKTFTHGLEDLFELLKATRGRLERKSSSSEHFHPNSHPARQPHTSKDLAQRERNHLPSDWRTAKQTTFVEHCRKDAWWECKFPSYCEHANVSIFATCKMRMLFFISSKRPCGSAPRVWSAWRFSNLKEDGFVLVDRGPC